jgi:hypothetical protein
LKPSCKNVGADNSAFAIARKLKRNRLRGGRMIFLYDDAARALAERNRISRHSRFYSTQVRKSFERKRRYGSATIHPRVDTHMPTD